MLLCLYLTNLIPRYHKKNQTETNDDITKIYIMIHYIPGILYYLYLPIYISKHKHPKTSLCSPSTRL